MVKGPYQDQFTLKHLMLRDYQMPIEEFWLRESEVLFKPAEGGIEVFVLDHREHIFPDPKLLEKKILPYLEICSLITIDTPLLERDGSIPLGSASELGKKSNSIRILGEITVYPEEMVQAIPSDFVKFLNETKNLHDKYLPLIEKFAFLDNALRYNYRSRSNDEYDSGKFIDAAIALESLFNEGPSDIRYKIALRASFILALLGSEQAKVFMQVKKLYGLRNDIVHGEGLIPTHEEIQQITQLVRRAIICFLVLCFNRRDNPTFNTSSKKMKVEILKEIDMGVSNKVSVKEAFQKEIGEGYKEFMLSIPHTFEKTGSYRVSW